MVAIRLLLFCIIALISSHLSSGKSSSSLVPALYVFGDSLFDSGNNNWLPTVAKANFPPYGVDFVAGPTGRFTNGKTVADFIADYLGLPYPPPYAKLLRPKSLTGYNYASGSCGILPHTGGQLGLCLNLGEQIKLFEETINHHLTSDLKNPTQLSQHLSNSIYIFSVGNNDYINGYFSIFSDESKRYTPPQFAQLLIDTLSQKLQRLYDSGARKMVIFELGPIGCIPSIVKNLKPSGKCDDSKNQIVSIFNKQLALVLNNLTSTLQDSHFVLGRANSLGYDAVINPTKYGLSDSSNPCCIAWLNGTLSCIPDLKSCASPNEHYFFDGYHPTEATCSVIASQCINNSSVCFPLNIQQLAQL